MSDVYALVRSIRDKRLPRNRFFDEHASLDGAEARRVHRFLDGLRHDLLAAEVVELERDDAEQRWRITMRFPPVRCYRVVSLNDDEHAILVEDPRIAARLASLTG